MSKVQVHVYMYMVLYCVGACYNSHVLFYALPLNPHLPQIKESTIYIEENGVRLELTVVDTPGFGDVVDNTNW